MIVKSREKVIGCVQVIEVSESAMQTKENWWVCAKCDMPAIPLEGYTRARPFRGLKINVNYR